MSKYQIVSEISLLLFLFIGIVHTTVYFFGWQLWFIGIGVWIVYLLILPKPKPEMLIEDKREDNGV